MQKRE
jgi:serine/threonine protein kinase